MARDGKLKSVEVRTGTSLELGPVRALFPVAVPINIASYFYAVTRDGNHFIVREAVGTSATGSAEQLYVVENWTSLVR